MQGTTQPVCATRKFPICRCSFQASSIAHKALERLVLVVVDRLESLMGH